MTSIPKPPVRHPSLPKNSLGLTKRDYEGAMSTLCAGCGHDSVTAALVQALWELERPAASRGEDERHRLLVQDDRVLPEAVARLQLRARAHAGARDRRERRESRSHLHRHLGRRRLAVDRTRPAVPRDPAQREHAVRAREQRRLRTHEGPVLGVVGRRLEVEEGRGERAAADRSGAARAHARRDVRRAQLLRRQDAAHADPQGGDAAQRLRARRRHLAVRELQRSRRRRRRATAYTREHYVEIAPVDFVPLRREITAETSDAAVQVRDDARRKRRALPPGRRRTTIRRIAMPRTRTCASTRRAARS